ncbi:hypothetical protein [uncultured Bifidobacterium sp.]|uniref:hypothetical protein n=1 Tax=uncultured Bifidobacterium sp. TaxID=165187 RepID=UPI000EC397C7|nr:hypothetical protein [uncultured Bifidobacterium sp.]HCA74097.1 hypothetical protein [Bifidobacterium sp.]
MSAQLLDPPAPPQQKRAQRPTVELIGDTGYAIRILEDKGGQLIHLGSFGETLMANISEPQLDNFIHGINCDFGNMR